MQFTVIITHSYIKGIHILQIHHVKQDMLKVSEQLSNCASIFAAFMLKIHAVRALFDFIKNVFIQLKYLCCNGEIKAIILGRYQFPKKSSNKPIP